MKRLCLLPLTLCLLFCTACAAQPGEPIPYQQPQNTAVEASAGWKDATEPEADALFRDPSYYSMPTLQSHEVLLGPETLLLRFRFGEGAKPEELTNAQGFMLSRFVLWKPSNFGGTPYDEFVKTQKQPQTVICEVYLGDALILQEQYQGTRLRSSYENMDILYAPRVVKDETTQGLTALVKRQVKSDVTVQKSLLSNCMVVNIKTGRPVTKNQLDSIKQALEGLLASASTGFPFQGVVLRFVHEGAEYTETYILEPDDLRWTKENWLEFPFQ